MTRTIRCVHCSRPVHPTRGGAYCVQHTPLDLTGGVAPSDRVVGISTRDASKLTVPRMPRGVPAEILRREGWTVARTVGAVRWWTDPGATRTITEATAVRRVLRAQIQAQAAGAAS